MAIVAGFESSAAGFGTCERRSLQPENERFEDDAASTTHLHWDRP
jgi:hypothetical protein